MTQMHRTYTQLLAQLGLKRFLILILACALGCGLQAKEGMWIPTLLNAVEGDMQASLSFRKDFPILQLDIDRIRSNLLERGRLCQILVL